MNMGISEVAHSRGELLGTSNGTTDWFYCLNVQLPEGLGSGKQILQPLDYCLFQVFEECLFWQ